MGKLSSTVSIWRTNVSANANMEGQMYFAAYSAAVKWKKLTLPDGPSSMSSNRLHSFNGSFPALDTDVVCGVSLPRIIPLNSSNFFNGRRATRIHCKIRITMRRLGCLASPHIRDMIFSYLEHSQWSKETQL